MKCNKIKKLETEKEYKPISTRINFKLQATDAVKETQGFKDLQTKVEATLDQLKTDLKKHVIECAKLEKAQLQEQTHSLATSLLRNSVAIFSTAHGTDPTLVYAVLQWVIREKGTLFLTHLHLTPDEFLAVYNTEYNCTEQVITLPEAASEVVNGVGQCLFSIMKTSWDAYIAQTKQN